MKHLFFLRSSGLRRFWMLAAGCLLTLTRCSDKVEVTRTYRYLTPVYMTTDEVRSSFAVEPPQTLSTTGKIYYRAPYLFINQPGQGIHVIDNSDPANPVNLSFINIPGNYDLAAQGDMLYADSFIDLLAIDISDLENVEIKKRVENVFLQYNSWSTFVDGENIILTEWVEEEVVEVLEGELDEFAPGLYRYQNGVAVAEWATFDRVMGFQNAAPTSTGGAAQPQTGIGGSMARFAIAWNRLYTVDDSNLQVFDITQADDPVAGEEIFLDWGIETIFPYQDKLFIGSQNSMFIFSTSNPDKPELESEFTHARSCDPVVANDSMAYVTLRSGTACWNGEDQLEVIDIRDLNSPQRVDTYAMENPHGLAIDGTTLFICEGEFGLKVFDATDSHAIGDNLLAHIDNIHAYDVIPLGDVLMVIGEDGLYQYDYRDPANLKLLSKLTLAAL